MGVILVPVAAKWLYHSLLPCAWTAKAGSAGAFSAILHLKYETAEWVQQACSESSSLPLCRLNPID